MNPEKSLGITKKTYDIFFSTLKTLKLLKQTKNTMIIDLYLCIGHKKKIPWFKVAVHV